MSYAMPGLSGPRGGGGRGGGMRGGRGGGRRGGGRRGGHGRGWGRGRRRGWGGGGWGWSGGWDPGYATVYAYDPCAECYGLPPAVYARCMVVNDCAMPLGQAVPESIVRETAGAVAGTVARGAVMLGVAVVGLSGLAYMFSGRRVRRNRRRSR